MTALVWAVVGAARARADDLWLVTEVEIGRGTTESAATARQFEQLLRARGIDVIDGASASSEFERRHSRTPRALPPQEIAKLDTALRKLADDLASENIVQARAALADVEALSPDVRDQLNHEVPRARRRFHICLLAAHLFAKEGYPSEASDQIRKCARDFPGLEPEQSPYLPESIRNFFIHAHQVMQSVRASVVHVDVENSSGRGCLVRVNGIDRGRTPATVDEVRTERVRIQVDCGGESGRIYDVLLEPGDNTVRIDPQLDLAVHTQGGLKLRYADAATAANNRLLHSLRIARAVGASTVLQLSQGDLHRIDVATREQTAIVHVSEPLGEIVDQVLARPASTPAQSLASDGSARQSAARPFAVLAWVSTGAAVLAGGGALVAWRVREGAVGEFNEKKRVDGSCNSRYATGESPECPGFLSSADSAETAIWVFGFAGISLLGLATTFFVLDLRGETAQHALRQGCGGGPGELGLACTVKF